jgi:hypothetical protein
MLERRRLLAKSLAAVLGVAGVAATTTQKAEAYWVWYRGRRYWRGPPVVYVRPRRWYRRY